MIKISHKPVSVNQVWAGRRFKTPLYKQYETAVLFMLPKLELPTPPFRLNLVFGFSNSASDIDNGCKPFIDVLQKKYGFNDKLITELNVKKELVKKGEEFIAFEILNAA